MTRAWSHRDPTGTVNGGGFTMDVAAWSEAPDHDFSNFITGPIALTINVPVGSVRNFYSTDNGFGTGYTFTVVEDSSMHTGTDGQGAFAQVEVAALVPANLDTNGAEWNMKLTLTPSNTNRPANAQTFRSNSTSGPVVIRVG